jgi:hypothetical protein
MVLNFKTEVVFLPQVDTVRISDITEGWGEGTNPSRADVEEAHILITYGEENTYIYTEDITTEFKTGENDFFPQVGTLNKDGAYKVFMVFSTTGYTPIEEENDYEYWAPNIVFVDKEIKAKISKFWTVYACTTNLERKKGIYNVCDWLETNFSGLEALALRREIASYMEVLDLINRKIELNKNFLITKNYI